MKNVLKKVRKELEKEGILLLTDQQLPSLVSIIAGGPVKGSWWGHPKGTLMYNCSNELEDQEDVLVLKLLNKKLTFVDRRHWDALFAIGTSRAEWQMEKLPPASTALLRTVQAKGELRADSPVLKKTPAEMGKIASPLELRLLVYSESIHTDSGKHVRLLKTWKAAAKGKGFVPKKMQYDAAISHFDALGERLSGQSGAKVVFPWS